MLRGQGGQAETWLPQAAHTAETEFSLVPKLQFGNAPVLETLVSPLNSVWE